MKMPIYPSDVITFRCSGCSCLNQLLQPLKGVCATPKPVDCFGCASFERLRRSKLWLAFICELRMEAPASEGLHRPTARSLQVFGYPRFIDVADD